MQMNILEELYFKACDTESRLYNFLTKAYQLETGKYKDLRMVLDYIFENSYSETTAERKTKYEEGVTPEAGKELLDSWIKESFYINNAKEIKNFLYTMINKGTDKGRAGFLDELNTMKSLQKTFSKDFKEVKVDYLGNNKNYGADFSFTLGYFDKASLLSELPVLKNKKIYFENKLNLENFHITSGGAARFGNGINNMIIYQMLNVRERLRERIEEDIKDSNYYSYYNDEFYYNDRSGDRYKEKIYHYNVKQSNIEYAIFCGLLYEKLRSRLPIFVTTSGGKPIFKLCSELIEDFSTQGKWNTHKGNTKITFKNSIYQLSENESQDLPTDMQIMKIGHKILADVNKYQLWYTKK